MRKALRPGQIADPVHGYVQFTSIERVILDHPVSQRLRYIAQTGLAHLVYPELRTSRFSHSLGAMHLASSFLSASLRNADPNVSHDICEELKQALTAKLSRMSNLEDIAAPLEKEPLLAAAYAEKEYKSTLLIVEQSLRLAALFHDIGHLPFSHDFENALDELWRELSPEEKDTSPLRALLAQQVGRTKLHERLGHGVSLLLLQELSHSLQGEPIVEAAKTTFDFAQTILDSDEVPSPTKEESAIQWLHTLMDGEIDVDRCDYILRDGRNYGFEFAAYDLNRILDNILVARRDGMFEVAINPHGLSAVETFLIARFRSYQYGIRHHKVAQIGAALQHSIARVLRLPTTAATLAPFLRDLAALTSEAPVDRTALLKRFAGYDDTWWMNVLRGIPAEERDEWLELVCWRQAGPQTLWKCRGDFQGATELSVWNERLPAKNDKAGRSRWFLTVSALRKEGVLVVRHTFQPWEVDPNNVESRLCVQKQGGILEPVSVLSPLIRFLRDAWRDDVQVQAFAQSVSPLTSADVLARLETAMSAGPVV